MSKSGSPGEPDFRFKVFRARTLPMNLIRFPKLKRIAFSMFVLLAVSLSLTIEISARGRHARGRSSRRASRVEHLSRRERRELGRRGGRVRLSRRELRAERERSAREESAYLAKLERHAGHKLSKRERQAELRRFGSKHRREIEEARRRA